MKSHRLGGTPDSSLQRGYLSQCSPGGRHEDLFGVRVQVQGIKGQPYVILNSSGQESHRDVSVITHQAGYNPGVAMRPVADGSLDRPTGKYKQSPSNSAGSNQFHYQTHPEILSPYDPQTNNLTQLSSSKLASAAYLGQLHSGLYHDTNQAPNGTKPRIPLPAESPGGDQEEAAPASAGQTHARSPNSVDTDPFLSVGKLISQFNSSQQRGRGGPRKRLDPDERRRSRSVDSAQISDSTSSSSSSRASSLKGIRSTTPSSTPAPGSARARLFGRGVTFANDSEENKPNVLLKETVLKLLHRGQKSMTSCSDQVHESDDRDTQVTPDLLKGQQELSVDPPEEAAKQMLFMYLKDGTTDDEPTTNRKVNVLFKSINSLKWKTTENVEDEEKGYVAQVKLLEEKQAALEKEVSELKKQLDVETKNEKTLAKACEKARTEKKKLQEELAKSQEELFKLRDTLAQMEAKLQSTKQELTLMIAERDRSKMEMKDLQQQLSEMHDELDRAKKTEVINTEKEILLKDMVQLRADFQEMLQVKEEQEEVLRHTEQELTALKGALKEEVETHDKFVATLKEEYEQEVQTLVKDAKQAKESNTLLSQEKVEAEEQRGTVKLQMKELSQERDQLKGKVQELKSKVDHLSNKIQECKATEKLLEHKAKQVEREKQQVEEVLKDVRKNEEEMCQSNQLLLTRLEDVQCKLSKLTHEHRELKEKLKEERKQTEELWKTKNDLEEEKRLQDRMVEQLQRKMNSIMEECESCTDTLQNQVDEAREKSQRELAELRRQLQEKGAEVEKSRHAAKKLQEELLPLKDDLLRCQKEQQEAQLRSRQLEQMMEELEERNTITVDDRERQVKLMEGRIHQLTEDLSDERSSADRLMERLDKHKEQMDQLRNELLQERGLRQDLECDKMSLERQNKDLWGRVTHLEGSQRTNQDSLVSKLNTRIQELEERLQGEQRDNNNLQQANRKLERKVKEMKMQADEEHGSLQSQRDQLTQKLKTAKRQMDEAEEEIEHLEHGKKKLQRDLDEQIEVNEQLHSQITALRNDARRKKKSTPLMMTVEDDVNDDLGSD
ncbi:cingulin-like protein 1 isoform X1 [Thalassophryne amazonica]|uniref:cingulin-like protein 1 isoform X1 n=1 Tax=Thalassophryne amazonica TaxID=390379 RepID=UPI0014720EF9|nr:cingulin-like protein 1 isoform X1 [Thalassophryne amazonica]XP_034032097.1 cingulin-like protein 1 isoform X1 [Thalassophryne amazonica]XP_034032098.1 cingulin-like protein 1 isoform X1 [Thalassophryne amazonica]